MNIKDRFKGAMFGMAAGDALGTTVEFQSRGSFPLLTTIIGGGVFDLHPGDWTDDTSMGLCIAESLGKRKCFDPVHQMDLFVAWWAHGHNSSRPDKGAFDMGATVRGALRGWKNAKSFGSNYDANPYQGSTDPNSAGNGCIMRLAPVPLFFYKESDEEIVKYCMLSSKTTHGAETCLQSSAFFGLMIAKAVQGKDKEALYTEAADHMLNNFTLHPEVKEVVEGSFKLKTERFIYSSGYVVQTLEAALWAFYKTDNFRDGALMAANLGYDADTVGAVYGQLAGAYYGYEGIPEEWRKVISRKDIITKYTDNMYKAVHGK
jgi:ADP-ribosylglycohydrolase